MHAFPFIIKQPDQTLRLSTVWSGLQFSRLPWGGDLSTRHRVKCGLIHSLLLWISRSPSCLESWTVTLLFAFWQASSIAVYLFNFPCLKQEDLIQCADPDSVQVSTKDMDSTLSRASRAIKKTSKKVERGTWIYWKQWHDTHANLVLLSMFWMLSWEWHHKVTILNPVPCRKHRLIFQFCVFRWHERFLSLKHPSVCFRGRLWPVVPQMRGVLA